MRLLHHIHAVLASSRFHLVFHSVFSFLYDISKKYKVYASDILYPTDMKDLLNRLGDKSFYLPFFDPFDEEDDSIHTFEKYGYLLVANEDDKKLNIYI